MNDTEFLFLVWFFRVWYGGLPGNEVTAVLEYDNDGKRICAFGGSAPLH